jgi:hypothetical protein
MLSGIETRLLRFRQLLLEGCHTWPESRQARHRRSLRSPLRYLPAGLRQDLQTTFRPAAPRAVEAHRTPRPRIGCGHIGERPVGIVRYAAPGAGVGHPVRPHRDAVLVACAVAAAHVAKAVVAVGERCGGAPPRPGEPPEAVVLISAAPYLAKSLFGPTCEKEMRVDGRQAYQTGDPHRPV